MLDLLGRKPVPFDQRVHQWSRGALAKLIGQVLQPLAQELVAADRRAKDMRQAALVTSDITLGFEP